MQSEGCGGLWRVVSYPIDFLFTGMLLDSKEINDQNKK